MLELRASEKASRRAISRPLDLVIVTAVGVICVQMLTGFRWHGPTAVSYLGDIAVAVLLLVALRRVGQELRRSEADALRLWPEALAAYTFVAVTLTVWAALALSPLDTLVGATAVSAAGKALLIAVALSVRLRALQRLTSRAMQQALVLSPAAAVVLSFGVAIAAGALLLSLPEATAGPRPISALDALFTSTSATCVTGLIVRDTPVEFGRFGLATILLLIQAGGLGIMTLGGVFSAARGQRVSLHQRLLADGSLVIRERERIADTLRAVAGFTFVCEVAGALVLFVRWLVLDETPARAAALAVFHSVSAFCNAGFALYSNSLEGHTGDVWISGTISLLIIVGGIGFPVVFDLRRYRAQRRGGERSRLSLHTRLVLVTTGYLLLIGFLGFLVLEANATLQGLSWPTRLQAAWFQAVTPRTAGFNTVPMGYLTDATKFLFVILMFIGASPGSTGGGIKTSTLATLAVLSRAMIHGRSSVHVYGREIPEVVRHRAVAIVILFGMSVLVCTFVLAVSERGHFIDLLFETVSAFGTVGLSTGVTPGLSVLGKIVLILAMYMGRVGPLTIALALAARKPAPDLRYPEEPVLVG